MCHQRTDCVDKHDVTLGAILQLCVSHARCQKLPRGQDRLSERSTNLTRSHSNVDGVGSIQSCVGRRRECPLVVKVSIAHVGVRPGNVLTKPACDLCFTRKIRCDLLRPVCSNCVLYGSACTMGMAANRARTKPQRQVVRPTVSSILRAVSKASETP